MRFNLTGSNSIHETTGYLKNDTLNTINSTVDFHLFVSLSQNNKIKSETINRSKVFDRQGKLTETLSHLKENPINTNEMDRSK